MEVRKYFLYFSKASLFSEFDQTTCFRSGDIQLLNLAFVSPPKLFPKSHSCHINIVFSLLDASGLQTPVIKYDGPVNIVAEIICSNKPLSQTCALAEAETFW